MLSDSVLVVAILSGTCLTAVVMALRVWMTAMKIEDVLHKYNSMKIEVAKLKNTVRGEVVEKVSPIGDILDELGIDIQSPFVRGMIQSLVKKSGILDKLQGKNTAIDEKNIYFED